MLFYFNTQILFIPHFVDKNKSKIERKHIIFDKDFETYS